MKKIMNMFKYKYNISLLFVITIVINTFVNSQFIKENLADFLIMNVIIVIIFLLSIINKKDRKDALKPYNTYEKIGKLPILVLLICVLSTLFSISVTFNSIKWPDEIMSYHQAIINAQMFALLLLGIANIKNIFYLFICYINPINIIIVPPNIIELITGRNPINEKIEKELKQLLRFFNDKTIQFQHTPPNNLLDVLNCVSFTARSKKKKAIYKLDYKNFYYNNKQFDKIELYNYLKDQKLKIDTMSNEDWKLAEMYLIH